MTRFGATPEEWDHFSLICGLTPDLLPVVANPNAIISENSSIKQLGKLPSLYNKDHRAIGISAWTDHISTPQEVDAWSKEPDYGACLIARAVKALDLDITDYASAADITMFIAKRLGVLPMRRRDNSSKLLLAFSMPGEYPKRTLKTKHGIIEFLSNRQQFLLAGTHTSGTRYSWSPALPDEFPEITPQQFDKLWAELAAAFGTAEPDTGSIRNPLSPTNFLPDPVADYLLEKWENHGHGKEGEIRIRCPFDADHTGDSGPTETVYFRAGSRDYERGHFSCLHAHCADKTDHDFEMATGYLAADFEEITEEPSSPRNQLSLITIGDYTMRPSVKWIIKDVLPREKLVLTYGGSGDGKTFAVLDMCFAIVRGQPWNECRVRKGRVVYICAEGAGGFSTRLKAYQKEFGVDLKALSNDFFIIAGTPNFRTDTDIKTIAKNINEQGKFDMIVIDTLAQVTPGADENAAKDMGLVLRNTEKLHELTGALCHLIAHAGKDPSRGVRGWSGIKAPLDAEFYVSREGDKRQFLVEKVKDGRDGFSWDFRLKPVEVDYDADGDLIQSCVVEYLGKSSGRRDPERKLGANQQLAGDVWEELGGGDVVAEDMLSTMVKRMIKPDGKDNRREVCRKAILKVIARAGYYIHEGRIVSDL